MVEGSTTYEWVLAAEDLLARPERWQELHGDRPTFVFTTRDLPVPAGADVRLVGGPVVEALPALREAVAPVALTGGAPLLPRRVGSDRLRLERVQQHGQFARLVYSVGR